ncbi:MAG: 2-dehydropantoate 2-reductase [Methanobacteriaceae archaeon]|nr:2-dehydropantoate 2-reductase [Methanobacteriaceae archaeon]MDP2836057.1 2-dehydropantoate 2-reductase [Methanobacteriaceae archaeon]MDP3035487.1 2-dehydropantoate 2-reductase [Methanobacteriaceae archaeon]MDP3485420.1 2-dehydropantoate 2-reductase [Methanobacteriaceae archaeon]
MNPETEIKNICIYGTGGVGGFFGGQMAHNLEKLGDESLKIIFIARGEHLRKIQEDGLILKTPKNNITAHPNIAVDNFKELESQDLILISVKGYDLDEVLNEISKNINEDTIILPLLNGVDIYHRIREKISKSLILPACVYVGTHIEKPGVVTQSGGDGKIIFGPDPEFPDCSVNSVVNLFDQLSINYEYQENALPAIWEKYMFIASFGLVSAAYNKTLGEIMENNELKDYVKIIMEEIVTIAEFEGVNLRKTIIEDSLEKGNNFPYETTTSYHKDLMKGKNNEGDLFGGTIIRLAGKYDVKTPFTEKLYSKIKNKIIY